jgi:hypothetical protein
MGDADYLTIGEFERTMRRVERSIDDGFKTTHLKQDTTNGRVLTLEGKVQTLELHDTRDERRGAEGRDFWSRTVVAAVSSGLSLVGGGFLMWVAHLVGWR